MCEYCFNAFDFHLPSGTAVCTECFQEMYCRLCWQHTNVVGPRTLHNDMMLCTTCVNNTPVDDPMEYEEINYEPINDVLLEPPEGFDMNAASLIEEHPDYMDNMINAQIEHNGKWYFVFEGQIYSIPYEIEIDDDYVRQDIVESWDGVEWAGSIFGNYIAWY